MNNFKYVARETTKKLIQQLIYKEAMEWPPSSAAVFYQPTRPSSIHFDDMGGSIDKLPHDQLRKNQK